MPATKVQCNCENSLCEVDGQHRHAEARCLNEGDERFVTEWAGEICEQCAEFMPPEFLIEPDLVTVNLTEAQASALVAVVISRYDVLSRTNRQLASDAYAGAQQIQRARNVIHG